MTVAATVTTVLLILTAPITVKKVMGAICKQYQATTTTTTATTTTHLVSPGTQV